MRRRASKRSAADVNSRAGHRATRRLTQQAKRRESARKRARRRDEATTNEQAKRRRRKFASRASRDATTYAASETARERENASPTPRRKRRRNEQAKRRRRKFASRAPRDATTYAASETAREPENASPTPRRSDGETSKRSAADVNSRAGLNPTLTPLSQPSIGPKGVFCDTEDVRVPDRATSHHRAPRNNPGRAGKQEEQTKESIRRQPVATWAGWNQAAEESTLGKNTKNRRRRNQVPVLVGHPLASFHGVLGIARRGLQHIAEGWGPPDRHHGESA